MIGKNPVEHHEKLDVASDLEKIYRGLSELKASFFPDIEFTESEADWSSSLHTCLRKYGNDPVDSALWEMIHQNRGIEFWKAFVKIVMTKKKMKKDEKNQIVQSLKLKVMTTDDVIIRGLLYGWDDDSFSHIVKTVNEWTSENE